MTPHKLRHTFASILVALGVDPASVMDQLGHTDPGFTLRVYRHGLRRDRAAREHLRTLVGGPAWANTEIGETTRNYDMPAECILALLQASESGTPTQKGTIGSRGKVQAMDATTRDERTATVHRYFEKPLLVAAVLSIPTTILQFTDVSESLHTLGETLNWLIWLAFLAELVTMLLLTPNRARYLLTNPIDLAIVVLTPPFLTSTVQSIRALRLLRVFRLLRLAPLARIVFSLEGVKATVGLALLTAMVGGAGFAAEEGISFGNGVYWAITTMTTVGSDITPKTTEGKIIAIVVMFVGIGTATLLIGAVAQRFLAPTVEHVETAEDDMLVQVQAISVQLGKLERALRERTQATTSV